MNLNYVLIDESELSTAERVSLCIRNERFAFIRYGGVLKINKGIPHLAELITLAESLWRIDECNTLQDDDATDAIYNQVESLVSDEAACQLLHAWSDESRAYRKKRDEQAAREWYEQVYDVEGLDALDEITSYDPGFLEALVSVGSEDKRRGWTNAIFLYAYRLGMEANV